MSGAETNTEADGIHRKKVAGWWVAFGACLIIVLICGGILVAGMIRVGPDDPLVDDPGAVLVGFMAVIGAVIAFVAPKLETIRHQVQNSHKTNLRDDLDEKFDNVLGELRGVRKDVGRIDDRQTRTERRLEQVFDKVEDLEDTFNPKEKQ